MKLQKLTEGSIKPWKFTTETVQMDQKGKIQFLHPELRGPAQCPFWKTLKTKIAANLKEGLDEVKVPKSFAIEVGKEYKVPLDPTYTTPVCIGAKICAHFRGVSKGVINCDFKLGVKAGPEKKVDVASTTEPVPEENKAEAPVKEEVGVERGSVPAISEAVGKYTFYVVNGKFSIHQPDPEDKSLNVKEIRADSSKEAKIKAIAKGWIKEEMEERIVGTSATPLVGLTDGRPESDYLTPKG